MARKTTNFRVGRVRGDLRGQVWYLTYGKPTEKPMGILTLSDLPALRAEL